MAIQKINIRGKEVDAEWVDANQTQERWNEYLLDDGSVVATASGKCVPVRGAPRTGQS